MDKLYWENYYKKRVAPEDPSLFAQHVADSYASEGDRLIELGCGNGRDAEFLGAQGVEVVAVDQAVTQVEALTANTRQPNVEYRAADFTNLDEEEGEYDIVYSRFTLHSVMAEEQHRALEWTQRALKIGGYLCIEVRGQKNRLFGLGTQVEGQPDAYVYEDHYRRFLDREDLNQEIGKLGLRIISSTEERGYAPFGDTDDYFIRHISRKEA